MEQKDEVVDMDDTTKQQETEDLEDSDVDEDIDEDEEEDDDLVDDTGDEEDED